MSVCPVYQTTFRETDVARGRLALLESVGEGTIAWSERLEEILSRCLLCGACAQICANSAPTNRLIQQGRQCLFEAGKGSRFSHPLMRSVRQGALAGRVAVKGGALLQGLLCRKIPDSSGLHLRFPLSFFAERATVPPVAWRPFLEAFRPEAVEKMGGARVGLFVGCGANYLFPETAWAVVRILKRMGATVLIPRDQVCCGLPAYVSGDTKTARALARKNIETFGSLEVDAVLTVCASCGSHLQDLGALLEDDPGWQDAAGALAARHRDAMAFLVEALGLDHYLDDQGSAVRLHGGGVYRVAYHDPCHLRIGQGITEVPRRLLQATPGVEFIEAPHPGQCCGHGGDFNLSHFDLSMGILDQRMEDFQTVEAHAIVTGCTGCLLQFAEGVSRKGLAGRVQVCHPLVLVERAMAVSGS
jgi:glycolate oxidase iron-sulfur subunit